MPILCSKTGDEVGVEWPEEQKQQPAVATRVLSFCSRGHVHRENGGQNVACLCRKIFAALFGIEAQRKLKTGMGRPLLLLLCHTWKEVKPSWGSCPLFPASLPLLASPHAKHPRPPHCAFPLLLLAHKHRFCHWPQCLVAGGAMWPQLVQHSAASIESRAARQRAHRCCVVGVGRLRTCGHGPAALTARHTSKSSGRAANRVNLSRPASRRFTLMGPCCWCWWDEEAWQQPMECVGNCVCRPGIFASNSEMAQWEKSWRRQRDMSLLPFRMAKRLAMQCGGSIYALRRFFMLITRRMVHFTCSPQCFILSSALQL